MDERHIETRMDEILSELRTLNSANAAKAIRQEWRPKFGPGMAFMLGIAIMCLASKEYLGFLAITAVMAIYWQAKAIFLFYQRRRSVTGSIFKQEEYTWWYESEER